jgi:glutamyl-tRNA reductase
VNLLLASVSHRTAAVSLRERLTVTAAQIPALLARLITRQHIQEVLVLATCNRMEVYAAASSFHGGLADVAAVLAEQAGCTVADLVPHLDLRYDIDVVQHAFRVTAGLDSLIVGEPQILGQFRAAYAAATDHGTVGQLLHELAQQALRVGKRVHTETGIDQAGRDVVTAALQLGSVLRHGPGGFPTDPPPDALVLGAGSMGALTVATLRRSGTGRIFIANRSTERAIQLANRYDADVVPFEDVPPALARVDLAVCAISSAGPVLTLDMLFDVRTPLLVVDLAVPRNVAPEVAALPDVVVVDLEQLRAAADAGWDADHATKDAYVSAAEDIVEAEVAEFRSWLQNRAVAPTVAALRARADEVIAAELHRLASRHPELTDEQRAAVALTVHRVVQRLLHSPSVRIQELATEPGGNTYVDALRKLFDLGVPSHVDVAAAGSIVPVTDQR